MPDLFPGLELSRLFYLDAVAPILRAHAPGLRHAAALLGAGSEVLGFDTAMSTDHNWGPRVDVFLKEADFADHRDRVHETLRRELPHHFRGFPTSFTDREHRPAERQHEFRVDRAMAAQAAHALRVAAGAVALGAPRR